MTQPRKALPADPVLAERERCARLCDQQAGICRRLKKAAREPDAINYHVHGLMVAENCAALIRLDPGA